MNQVIAFPSPKPELRLASAAGRAEAALAVQAAERHQLEQDHEALRDREANLRDYEARLRAWQAQIESGLSQTPSQYISPVALGRGPSGSPFEGDTSLQAGWEKLHRARELLDAEQAHVRDDRLNLKETAAVLKRHEAALQSREDALAKREQMLADAIAAHHAAEQARPASTLARITGAPFAIAKSVFGGKSEEQE